MADRFQRTLPARAEQLPALTDAIEQWMEQAGVPSAHAVRLMVAFDELLSNIARHGATTLSIAAAVEGDRLTATLVDDGPAFDPLAMAPPDTGLGIEERAIGGLGIHLVREMMDEVVYTHAEGRNRLSIGKTLSVT